jgi:hypothetical protein
MDEWWLQRPMYHVAMVVSSSMEFRWSGMPNLSGGFFEMGIFLFILIDKK